MNQFVAFGVKKESVFVARWDTVEHIEIYQFFEESDSVITLYENYFVCKFLIPNLI